jgi:exopolysaccharide biosynthesis polyprenyl glycosylphosphotransferase
MSHDGLKKLAAGATARMNLLADLSVLFCTLLLSSQPSDPMHRDLPRVLWLGAAIAATWTVTAIALRHYDPWATEREPIDDGAMVSILVLAVATVLGVVKWIAPQTATVPQLGNFLLLLWPTVILSRLLIFRRLASREEPLDEVLVVGSGPLGRATARDIVARGRRRLLGYLRFPDEARPAQPGNLFLGASAELDGLLKSVAVSEVFIAGNALRQGPAMQRAIQTCERYGIPFALPAYSFRLDRAQPNSPAVADGYLHYQTGTLKPYQQGLKRLLDILISGAAIWMLLPLLAITAALVKLSSRGPIFFGQVRVGLRGKPFRMLKFRSMVADAEARRADLEAQNEQAGPVFKLRSDPRITPVGRFIRKYSIDELPQLLNVLRGDMSLVGPRPPIPSEVLKYEPWQRRRLSVRPGLTCIWQVSGRNQISFEQWMYLDMRYIDHWSLAQDVNLILRTIPVVIGGRGAS